MRELRESLEYLARQGITPTPPIKKTLTNLYWREFLREQDRLKKEGKDTQELLRRFLGTGEVLKED